MFLVIFKLHPYYGFYSLQIHQEQNWVPWVYIF